MIGAQGHLTDLLNGDPTMRDETLLECVEYLLRCQAEREKSLVALQKQPPFSLPLEHFGR